MLIVVEKLTACRPSLRLAMRERDGQAIAGLCTRAVAAGAHWFDLNPGYVAPKERAELWLFLVATAEAACPLTLMLDAPEPESLALALNYCSRPPILNRATAQPERLIPVLELAAAHGLDPGGSHHEGHRSRRRRGSAGLSVGDRRRGG
jgi:cobalamin-dependent methionine synthase I